jgi:hypothetical protein
LLEILELLRVNHLQNSIGNIKDDDWREHDGEHNLHKSPLLAKNCDQQQQINAFTDAVLQKLEMFVYAFVVPHLDQNEKCDEWRQKKERGDYRATTNRLLNKGCSHAAIFVQGLN